MTRDRSLTPLPDSLAQVLAADIAGVKDACQECRETRKKEESKTVKALQSHEQFIWEMRGALKLAVWVIPIATMLVSSVIGLATYGLIAREMDRRLPPKYDPRPSVERIDNGHLAKGDR